MRIAFVVTKFPVLVSETAILNQVTGLLDRGHEVHLLAERPGNLSTLHPQIEAYGLLDRTFYRRMPRNRLARVLKGIGLFLVNLPKAPLPLLRSLNIWRYGIQAASLNLLYAVTSLRERRSYDIIHCQFGPNGLRGMFLRESGLVTGKLITQFRGSDLNVYPRIAGNAVYQRLFQEGDAFLANSRFLVNRAVALGCPQGKILTLPGGVDLQKIAFAQRRLVPGCPIRILTVARLVEVKGVEYAIRAIAGVSARFPDIRYTVVGEGPLLQHLQTLARQLGIGDRVEFLGGQTRDQIHKLYADAHLFVLSGVVAEDGGEEGLPNVVAEAQAAGLPVLASRVGGIPEVVLDGKSGFLLPQRDVAALVDKLSYLIENPQFWPEMGRAGRKYVENHYDLDRQNDRLVDIYEQLLDGTLS